MLIFISTYYSVRRKINVFYFELYDDLGKWKETMFFSLELIVN